MSLAKDLNHFIGNEEFFLKIVIILVSFALEVSFFEEQFFLGA